ncbi:cytochrome-c oxidase, cbb3-type subunit I [Neolewinella agarilytica]|uniref:cytochrome-c oxidase n=1 Tax=Neolewinella agarilytica TaxID=478744 RepID=A0A1H9ENY5_9BACT|nr:cytochrome-c oxidase, cbb3-type subunit I [Neolewinella agarilytica]SEQ27430.1 cytochrome c oxidase cbb3-type subunit I/II [Neolewinella agarilytica]
MTQTTSSAAPSTTLEQFAYDNLSVKRFAYATAFWGLIGMTAGLLAALQMIYPSLNFTAETTFGRIRPLHTNAVIFAFVGNGIFMGVYYSLQRLLKTRMWSDLFSAIHFYGWQAIILAAAITLPLGITTSKEYAELEWPIDIGIALIWIVFGINMFMTIMKRRERHLYVAIWFFIATWVTVTVLHVGNSLELPVSLTKSYPVFAGVQDALIQWWYGHNAVAFFLTTPYLGLMYYFLPKAANRPVFSYRLSIIHFWALIFIYIWAGPHHLLYTSLPDWAQSLGMVFSLMLIAPSWGGMLNGLLTLRGAWDKVREDPVLKMMVVAVTAYGMATLEGPLLSIKSVNAISHYTDWTVGHVHIGTLGWNGMLTFGVLYYIIPRIFNTKLFSTKLANAHFWIATLGTLFYAVPLYVAGWTQSSMWKQFTPDGLLQYGNFLETVSAILPMYKLRALGGTIYLIGVILMIYNLIKTVKQGEFANDEPAAAPPLAASPGGHKGEYWHRWIERRPVQLLVGSTIVVLIGGLAEVFPMVMVEDNVPKIAAVMPYTPLELEGRDIYIRDGCNNCHSQMIRPFRSETERYGQYSMSGEFIYDRPHLWGSKRTGPDVHRLGGKYPDSWHYRHMENPQSTSPGSIMPPYDWMLEKKLNTNQLAAKINALRMLGTPYAEGYENEAINDLRKQAAEIAASLRDQGIEDEELEEREIVALIAYLQRLGTDIKTRPQATSTKK